MRACACSITEMMHTGIQAILVWWALLPGILGHVSNAWWYSYSFCCSVYSYILGDWLFIPGDMGFSEAVTGEAWGCIGLLFCTWGSAAFFCRLLVGPVGDGEL